MKITVGNLRNILSNYPDEYEVVLSIKNSNHRPATFMKAEIKNSYTNKKTSCLVLQSSWIPIEQERGLHNEEKITLKVN